MPASGDITRGKARIFRPMDLRRVAFQRLNADEDDGRAAAQTYRVRGHPAIVVINAQGDVVWSRVGVQPRGVVVSALESALAGENK